MDYYDALEVDEREIMTVYLFTGTPGSGKSVHQAMIVYYAIKLGKPVIANYEINTELFKDASTFTYLPNDYMTPQALEEYARWYFQDHEFGEGKIKVFIDEAQIKFNSRDWRDDGKNNRNDWIKFFTQHRKLGMDVYLVAQFHEMIDKQIRTLVEYEVSHRKVNNVGWFGKLVSIFALGHSVFVGVTRWYGQKMRLSSEWFLGRNKYYQIYDTYKIFDA